MDVDQAKSSPTTEDQMETMMMMTMMLPELYDAVDHPFPPPTFTNHFTTDPFNNFPDHHSHHPPPYLHQLPPFNENSYNPNTELHEPPLKGSSSAASPSSMAAMREMIFRIAAMQPVHIDPEAVKPPKRKNVRISKDPQSVAARHRRERISERIRILQRLVPGGTKMDTASMLDEAILYVKFLKTQVQSLERAGNNNNSNNSPCSSSTNSSSGGGMGFPVAMSTGTARYFPMGRGTVHEDFRDASS